MSTTVALRTAMIWRDEVMDDVVLTKPSAITVGHVGKPTFIVPELGLPQSFAIVRPGNRGYLLTLGKRMRGTICIDGQQKDVAEFVRAAGEGDGGFHATPISGRDWGVIDLDESGDYKLFFQFVPVEEPPRAITKRHLVSALTFFLMVTAGLSGFLFKHGAALDTIVLCSTGIGIAATALLWAIVRQDGNAQAAFGFSIVLHVALLILTFTQYVDEDQFVWPGSRAMTANYLATRLEKPPEPPKAPTVSKSEGATAALKSPEPPKKTATKNDQGTSGGKGEHERMRDKNAKDAPISNPKDTLLDPRAKEIYKSFDKNLVTRLDKFNGIKGDETRAGDAGFGPGRGTGVGAGLGTGTTRGSKGTGTGGGGNSEGDFVSDKGKIDTGKERPGGGTCAKPPCGNSPHEVKVSVGEAEGDIEGLTADEINRVVKARSGVFRACYQKELNRSPGLGGKVVMHFVIGADGTVKSAKTGGGSTMRNDSVEECISRQIMGLHFPAKGGLSNVNYPFLFQPGG